MEMDPLNNFIDGHHVQWTCPLDMMDPMDYIQNSSDPFTGLGLVLIATINKFYYKTPIGCRSED